MPKTGASFPPEKSCPITYSCPLGLFLAASWQQTPQIIVQELGNLMASTTDNYHQSLNCELLVEIVPSGWLNFYLDAKFIASWLERSPPKIRVLTDKHQQWIKQDIASKAETPASLFFPQYIHARCCSLLLLGARENLIRLSLNGEKTTWQINQPSPISWLDKQDNLWLNKTSERNLLEQLLRLTDSWQENHPEYYWSKLAHNLSQSISIFLAECRFLGEVKQQCPPKAIARLRLIALVRFWLEKILQEKLYVAAPQTM
ncbi:MAG: DALR anticodon-binding domain-containing protein [Cyanobacteria bacterium J06631_2]